MVLRRRKRVSPVGVAGHGGEEMKGWSLEMGISPEKRLVAIAGDRWRSRRRLGYAISIHPSPRQTKMG